MVAASFQSHRAAPSPKFGQAIMETNPIPSPIVHAATVVIASDTTLAQQQQQQQQQQQYYNANASYARTGPTPPLDIPLPLPTAYVPPLPPAPSPLPSDRQFLFIYQHPQAGLQVVGSPGVPFLASLFHYKAPGSAHVPPPVPLRMVNDEASWYCDRFVPLHHILTQATLFGWHLDGGQMALRADWPPEVLKRYGRRHLRVNALTFSACILSSFFSRLANWYSKKERTDWRYVAAALTTRSFGVPLWRMAYAKTGAPAVLQKLLTHLSAPGNLDTPYLFEAAVDARKTAILRERMDRGEDLNLYLYDAHASAALLKDWLCQLQEPLIPHRLLPKLTPLLIASYQSIPYPDHADRTEQSTTNGINDTSTSQGNTLSSQTPSTGSGAFLLHDPQLAIQMARDTLHRSLPPHLMHLLALLTRFLRLVASQSSVNHMTAEKLGVIFGDLLCKETALRDGPMVHLRNRTVLSMLIRFCIAEWTAFFETPSRPPNRLRRSHASSPPTATPPLQPSAAQINYPPGQHQESAQQKDVSGRKTSALPQHAVTPAASPSPLQSTNKPQEQKEEAQKEQQPLQAETQQKQKAPDTVSQRDLRLVSPPCTTEKETKTAVISPAIPEGSITGRQPHRAPHVPLLRRIEGRPATPLFDEISPPTTFLAADSDSDDEILPNCSVSAVGHQEKGSLLVPPASVAVPGSVKQHARRDPPGAAAMAIAPPGQAKGQQRPAARTSIPLLLVPPVSSAGQNKEKAKALAPSSTEAPNVPPQAVATSAASLKGVSDATVPSPRTRQREGEEPEEEEDMWRDAPSEFQLSPVLQPSTPVERSRPASRLTLSRPDEVHLRKQQQQNAMTQVGKTSALAVEEDPLAVVEKKKEKDASPAQLIDSTEAQQQGTEQPHLQRDVEPTHIIPRRTSTEQQRAFPSTEQMGVVERKEKVEGDEEGKEEEEDGSETASERDQLEDILSQLMKTKRMMMMQKIEA